MYSIYTNPDFFSNEDAESNFKITNSVSVFEFQELKILVFVFEFQELEIFVFEFQELKILVFVFEFQELKILVFVFEFQKLEIFVLLRKQDRKEYIVDSMILQLLTLDEFLSSLKNVVLSFFRTGSKLFLFKEFVIFHLLSLCYVLKRGKNLQLNS